MKDCRSKNRFSAAVVFGLFLLNIVSANAQLNDLEDTYQFLVSDRKAANGALYIATAGELKGAYLPLSFYSSPEYWGQFVCSGVNFPCVVTDTYEPANFTVKPELGLAGDLQTERVNVHNGANIYDAATWQIAVVLGEVVNKFGNPTKLNARVLAGNQNRLLSFGYSGNARKVAPHSNRATSRGETFIYNGRTIERGAHAYTFRMLPRDWLSTDPLIGTIYGPWITAQGLPKINSDYRRGKITWADWKPVTGENAWAFLLGPLHAAYIHHVIQEHKTFVPYRDVAIQNALSILPTFAAMQSQIGGVYYAPAGTVSNQGKELVSPYQVSIENNFSLYAGLRVFEETLRAELRSENSLKSGDKAAINSALNTISVMINGGRVGENKPTEGLLSFFKTKAWRNGEFIQGGLANDPKEKLTWVPTLDPKAVDVTTWGIAAIGARTVDEWFGFGAAYNSWQQTKTWGAYGAGRNLWGVGYSNKDGNGINPDGTYRQGILSAEWTAGAINMIRGMINYYTQIQSTSNGEIADSYVLKLKDDEMAMLEGVQKLRFDNYVETPFPGKPHNYSKLISQHSKSYLYASRRHLIPFGWYANPIPSTCSTAWIIMLANDYDPFIYGGKIN